MFFRFRSSSHFLCQLYYIAAIRIGAAIINGIIRGYMYDKIYFYIPSRLNSGMKSEMLAPSSCINPLTTPISKA